MKNRDSYDRLLSLAAGVMEGLEVLEKAWKHNRYFRTDMIATAADMSRENVEQLLPAMKVAGLVRNGPSRDRWGRAH